HSTWRVRAAAGVIARVGVRRSLAAFAFPALAFPTLAFAAGVLPAAAGALPAAVAAPDRALVLAGPESAVGSVIAVSSCDPSTYSRLRPSAASLATGMPETTA